MSFGDDICPHCGADRPAGSGIRICPECGEITMAASAGEEGE